MKTPNAVAAVGAGEVLTYRELMLRSVYIAKILRDRGIRSGSIVAISCGQSIEMISGIMGILFAGAAYLPIDPDYPPGRVEFMLNDCGADILLNEVSKDRSPVTDNLRITNPDFQKITLSEIQYPGAAANFSGSPSVNSSVPANLPAYIIYTSGSTGKPKGVILKHCSLVNLVNWHNLHFGVTPSDRATKYAGFGFDASVWEIFPYLTAGALLCIVPEDVRQDIGMLTEYFKIQSVTIGFLPTQMCELFMDTGESPPALRVMLTGGDRLRQYRETRYRLFNNYGPTENAVVTTSFEVSNGHYARIPIGKPVFNSRVYILNRNYNLQPVGVPGELCIAGDGLARGYLNQPELTAEKFIQFGPPDFGIAGTVDRTDGLQPLTPFRETFYRTGDSARWLSDGNIEFLGRIDQQVKIRGFRIELGEIETCLMKHPEVKEAVVALRNDTRGGKFLCAYITSIEGSVGVVGNELSEYLLTFLPDYMIPSYFVPVDLIPLTPSGKVDYKALPEPEMSPVDTGPVAPTNPVEKQLLKLWQEVLGNRNIGITDKFFEVGGDSIKVIQISAGLKKFGLQFKVNDLFLYPTVQGLAKVVTENINPVSQEPVEGEVLLTPIQQWYFQRGLTDPHHFNYSTTFYNESGFDVKFVQMLFNRIVTHHDALRTVFRTEGGRVSAKVLGIYGQLFDLQLFNLENADDWQEEMVVESNRIQRSINLETGPLIKLALFKTDIGDHLLVSVHHLVVDVISWRILFEDFATGYRQWQQGRGNPVPRENCFLPRLGTAFKGVCVRQTDFETA